MHENTGPTTQKDRTIEGSRRYYEVKDKHMHLFSNSAVAYRFVTDELVRAVHPEFTQVTPDNVCVLGGFFPNRKNIERFHQLAAENNLPIEQCVYVDFNAEPVQILDDAEASRFHQINLKDIATVTNEQGELLFKPGSVKFIVLDYVTEFMDQTTLNSFFAGLSTVLAPDGVALMSVIETPGKLAQFWHKIRARISMGVQTFPRSPQEWFDAASAQNLKTPFILSYKVDTRDGQLFVISRADAPYPDRPIQVWKEPEELTSYDLAKSNKENPQASVKD